jgi:hypothetical protein
MSVKETDLAEPEDGIPEPGGLLMRRGTKIFVSAKRELVRKRTTLRSSGLSYTVTKASTAMAKSFITVYWMRASHSRASSWPEMALEAVVQVRAPPPNSRWGGGFTFRSFCLFVVRLRLEGN